MMVFSSHQTVFQNSAVLWLCLFKRTIIKLAYHGGGLLERVYICKCILMYVHSYMYYIYIEAASILFMNGCSLLNTK